MRFSETFRMKLPYSCIHALTLAMKRFVLKPVRSACDHVLAARMGIDKVFFCQFCE
jgi:hypothetical protein